MKKNFFIAIFLLLIFIFQVSFLNNFNNFFLKSNLIIIAFILMLNILSFNKVIILGAICGFLMDIFSSMPFGTFLLTYTVTIFITEIFFLNFFTNHSLYSIVILGVLAIVIFNLFFLAVCGAMYFLNISNFTISTKYWIDFIWQIIDSSVVLAIAFYFINNGSRLFKPVFLRQ